MSEVEDSASTAFHTKITKQIEYYFGDKNLPRDKYLLQQLEENDGWVSMECLLTFSRLNSIVRNIIATSLRMHGSGLLEVDEGNTKVRRVKPMPEINDEYNSLAKEKTVYCKGFPETSTLDDIEEFFENKGKCVFIKMRRELDEKKTFKGSVFVEFDTKETAAAFLAMKDLKFKGNELIYMTRDDYFKSKKEKGSEHDEQDQTKEEKQQKEEGEEKPEECPKGRVIHFSGAGDQASREDVREIFNAGGFTVEWIDFRIGEKEGFVRFKNDGDGEKAVKFVLEANDNKVSLRGVETKLRVIEGDEETNYWKKLKESKQKSRKGWKNSRSNHHKGKREKRGNHGESGENKAAVKEEPPAKVQKLE